MDSDPSAYTFKRAFIQKVNRLKENRRDIRQGRLRPQSETEARALTAVTGTVRVPVLLGVYSNTGSAPIPASTLQKELFDGPWETGTMQDYYREVSYGNLTVDGTVYDWVTTSNTDEYYAGEVWGRDPRFSHVGEYITEILALNDSAIDFGQYDNDGPDGIANSGDDDGYVDFIAIVHPETGAECHPTGLLNNVWSHRWRLAAWPEGEYASDDPAAGGGVIRIDDYTIMPALNCRGGMIEIGVFCHEFGHAFGLPDLYDRDFDEGSEQSFGIGYWGLMGYGGWNTPTRPAHMEAWSKAELGWLDPTVVTFDLFGWPIASSTASPTAFKLWANGGPGPEYFLVEYRTATGFDRHLRGEGLLIWHVDESRANNNLEEHKLLDLECWDQTGPDHTIDADQLDSRVSYGGVGDPYYSGRVFSPSTNPSSVSYRGAETGVEVAGLSMPGEDTMVANLVVGDLPESSVDLQNAPNPFAENTRLLYTLPHSGQVNLTVYSVDGRRIRQLADESQRPGLHSVSWDGRDDGGREVAAGAYICKFTFGSVEQTRILVRVR